MTRTESHVALDILPGSVCKSTEQLDILKSTIYQPTSHLTINEKPDSNSISPKDDEKYPSWALEMPTLERVEKSSFESYATSTFFLDLSYYWCPKCGSNRVCVLIGRCLVWGRKVKLALW